jgi:hypothetical protein
MAYIRKKILMSKIYYYIVKGNLDSEGKVKQKVLLYLGNIDNVMKMAKFYKEHAH